MRDQYINYRLVELFTLSFLQVTLSLSLSLSASVNYILSFHRFVSLIPHPITFFVKTIKMLARMFYIAALALSAAKVNGDPVSSGGSLPNCASAPADCTCPSGTTLQNSTTYAIIGASAKNVKAITGNCEWLRFH